ncbi:uncharacterized protein LOC134213356 [Armigeres subalbatus]|uniref:uncharacterized protein LOC134213356 n=1 Tax=Armigeres subalbatus TaxID=124917 RepID=UPI002ED2327D
MAKLKNKMWVKLLLVGYVIVKVSGANVDIDKVKPKNSTYDGTPDSNGTADKNSNSDNTVKQKRHADWYEPYPVDEYEFAPEPEPYYYETVPYYVPYEPYHKPPTLPPTKRCKTTTTAPVPTPTIIPTTEPHHVEPTTTPAPPTPTPAAPTPTPVPPTPQPTTSQPQAAGTTTAAPSGLPFSADQVTALLGAIRDTKAHGVQSAVGYLFPPQHARSEPTSTCGCDEEIRQLQHAILLLQESVRQLRNFIHSEDGVLLNGNTKVVKISRKAVEDEYVEN